MNHERGRALAGASFRGRGRVSTVLVFGRTPEMMQRVIEALDEAGFPAFGVSDDGDALDAVAAERFDVLVIGGGVEPKPRKAVLERVGELKPWVKVVEHRKADPSAVVGEVRAALGG